MAQGVFKTIVRDTVHCRDLFFSGNTKFRLMTDAFVAVNFIINTIGGILGLLAYKRYDPDKDTDVTYTKRTA